MRPFLNETKERMKILYLSDVYFPRVNGVSTSIRTFVAQLQQMGHEVHLLAPDYQAEGATPATDEYWINRIPARRIFSILKTGLCVTGRR